MNAADTRETTATAELGPETATPPFDPLILPRLLIWAVLFAIGSYTLADPDLWGNVRLGLDILELGGFPASDPYSFTSDRRWVNHEWLAEVVMAGAYLAGGPLGLSLLKALLLVATFAIVVRELRARGVPPMAQDALLALGVVCCLALIKTFRPQTFSLLLFAGLLVTLRRVEHGQRWRLWTCPPALLLWANLHGGWLVGLGVLGLFTAIRCLTPMGASRTAWAITGLASVAATLGTPQGIDLWRFLWDTVGLGRPDISEWQPLTVLPAIDSLTWAIASLVAVIGIVRSRERRLTHVATIALLMVVAFRVLRVVPFFAIATVLLAGPHLFPAPVRSRAAAAAPPLAIGIIASVVLMVVAASGVVAYRNMTCLPLAGDSRPDQRAAGFIRQTGLGGRMLTYFDWGHYAIWFLSPDILISMDGRRETIYSDEMVRKHLAIYRGAPGWREDLEQIDPDHILLPATVPTLDDMERLGWRRVFATEQSVVLSRHDLPRAPVVASEPSACFPGAP